MNIYEKARQQFTPEAAEVEYEKHLRQLAALDAAGKNDTDEADAIREKMELPWLAMDDDGMKRMTDLSISLLEDAETK
jgi:hypothetical protein